MYRRQPVDGGFMWRIGISPMLTDYGYPTRFIALPGFAMGYAW